MEPEGEDTRPLRHIAKLSCIHSFSRYILRNYTCQSLLGAVDTAKNETCVAHGSFKNAAPVSSPLKPALCSQTPYLSPGLSVQRRGCTSSSGTGNAGRRHRAYAGCHTPGGRGTVGVPWCPIPLDSNSSCLAFWRPWGHLSICSWDQTRDTQGTVQQETLNEATHKFIWKLQFGLTSPKGRRGFLGFICVLYGTASSCSTEHAVIAIMKFFQELLPSQALCYLPYRSFLI